MKAFSILSLLLVTALSFGHEGHDHEAAVEAPPHGGLLRNVQNAKNEVFLKSEAVINGDAVKLYVYDKALKPVQLKQDTLKGDVQFPREKAKPVTFKKATDHYTATVTGISKKHRFDMHVELEADGQKGKADFGIDNIN